MDMQDAWIQVHVGVGAALAFGPNIMTDLLALPEGSEGTVMLAGGVLLVRAALLASLRDSRNG